mgnify:CR=1 FL=1
MFEWLFGAKKEVKKIEEDTKQGFDSVKKDINKIITRIMVAVVGSRCE